MARLRNLFRGRRDRLERDLDRELRYHVERRVEDGIQAGLSEPEATAAADRLDATREHRLTASLLRLHAANLSLAARDAHRAARLTAAHPIVPVTQVPALSIDVNDLGGLRRIAVELVARP